MWITEVINKDGTKKYKYTESYYDPKYDKRRYKSVSFPNKTRDTQKRAKEMLTNMITNEVDQESTNIKRTLKSVIDEYCIIYQKNVKRSTFISIADQYTRFVEFIGEKRILQSITPQMLNKFFDYLLYTRDLNNSTVSIYKSRINKLFLYCKKNGYIKDNPVDNVIIEYKRAKTPKKKANKFLEQFEYKQLIEYTRNINKRYALLFEWLYLTGMRCGEALALSYDKIDFTSQPITATVDTTLEYKKLSIQDVHQSDSPKTKSSIRTIALPDRAVDILYEAQVINGTDKGFVFVTSKHTPTSLHAINTFLRNARIKLNIDKPISSHIFRHTHISKLAELGIPLHVIQNRVGHEHSNITEQIYLHVTQKSKDKMYQAIKDL